MRSSPLSNDRHLFFFLSSHVQLNFFEQAKPHLDNESNQIRIHKFRLNYFQIMVYIFSIVKFYSNS